MNRPHPPVDIHINPDGPLAGLTRPEDVSAVPHPNRTSTYNGTLPPEDLVVPFGAMVAVHVFADATGQRGIKLPDSLKTWQTPTVVIIATGDECKWLERGDVACLRPEVAARLDQETLRVGDWQIGMVHEQQTMGRIPSLRVLDTPRKLDQKVDVRTIADKE